MWRDAQVLKGEFRIFQIFVFGGWPIGILRTLQDVFLRGEWALSLNAS
jgi:hypothetical protein